MRNTVLKTDGAEIIEEKQEHRPPTGAEYTEIRRKSFIRRHSVASVKFGG